MAATWSDLPPEVVDLVARALLRLCYTDVHRSRTTPRGELEGHGAWKRKSVPAGSVGVLDAELVDAPTWAAAAPAAAVCRQLRRALLAAVGGLALRVPSLETNEDHVGMEDALPPPWELRGGSAADRYTTAWRMGTVGILGTGVGGLGRWLYFFPAAVGGGGGGSADQTASLAAFVRSCPRLRAVEVWDSYRSSGMQSMFILRSPAAEPRDPRRGASAAAPPPPPVRRPPGSATQSGATDEEAPLRLAVSQHLGIPVNVYYDHSWGFQAPGVAEAAAAGGPALHRRATLWTGCSVDEKQDDQFGVWIHNHTLWMIAQARLALEQRQAQAHASGTPAGSV